PYSSKLLGVYIYKWHVKLHTYILSARRYSVLKVKTHRCDATVTDASRRDPRRRIAPPAVMSSTARTILNLETGVDNNTVAFLKCNFLHAWLDNGFMEMWYASGKVLVPGVENPRRSKAIGATVAHKYTDSLLDRRGGRFKQEKKEFPDRESEKYEECKDQLTSSLNAGDSGFTSNEARGGGTINWGDMQKTSDLQKKLKKIWGYRAASLKYGQVSLRGQLVILNHPFFDRMARQHNCEHNSAHNPPELRYQQVLTRTTLWPAAEANQAKYGQSYVEEWNRTPEACYFSMTKSRLNSHTWRRVDVTALGTDMDLCSMELFPWKNLCLLLWCDAFSGRLFAPCTTSVCVTAFGGPALL
ncbi:hypothetical protein C8R43DRAFT_1144754, partial [Mycena crocata]